MVDFHHPDKLKDMLDLEIPEKSLTLDQLLEDCRDTLKYQVKTGNVFGDASSRFIKPGVDVLDQFQHNVSKLYWNKALRSDVASHVTSFDQSLKCFSSVQNSYTMLQCVNDIGSSIFASSFT